VPNLVLKPIVGARRASRVLEVGCGSGSFAHLLLDRSKLDYQGFDFSEVAIRKVRARTGRPDRFSVAKAGDETSLRHEHDTIVCLEVLEHIENELEVVRSWKPGVLCVCSVPNFDQPDHVRFFRSEDEIARRYGDLIDLASIRCMPRALVRVRGWADTCASYGGVRQPLARAGNAGV
jgi:2-polyprenyl-3-methyl-5-hydroxy-6-metoxy-1,4-benzoquinol methylase